MANDPAFPWEGTRPKRRRRGIQRSGKTREPATAAVEFGGRITLKEAESRFGVPVTRLRAWAREGDVNAVMGPGPKGGRMWLVTPESVARRLSREASTEPAPPEASEADVARTGPTADGTAMLVPRDAWDRLMDQLGNLHDAGIQLAEARERAARAETEASFLRERLSELRGERDELKTRADAAAPPPAATPPPARSEPATITDRLREAYLKLIGK